MPEIVLHVTITSWRHDMTSWHFCNMSMKCPNDLGMSFYLSPAIFISVSYLHSTSRTPKINISMLNSACNSYACHDDVMDVMPWRHKLTATCCKVAQWPTRVVKPRKWICNQVYMLISAWDCFACHEMTSWRHVMTSWHFCNMSIKCPNDLGMSFYLSRAIFISVSHLQHSIHHFFHPG